MKNAIEYFHSSDYIDPLEYGKDLPDLDVIVNLSPLVKMLTGGYKNAMIDIKREYGKNHFDFNDALEFVAWCKRINIENKKKTIAKAKLEIFIKNLKNIGY